jgi:hypothetical protein
LKRSLWSWGWALPAARLRRVRRRRASEFLCAIKWDIFTNEPYNLNIEFHSLRIVK